MNYVVFVKKDSSFHPILSILKRQQTSFTTCNDCVFPTETEYYENTDITEAGLTIRA